MVFESIGQMIADISVLGAGMTFGILGLVAGITRGMSKNNKLWALTFGAFAWIIALIAPTLTFGIIIFTARKKEEQN